MTQSETDPFAEALALSPESKANLAEQLLASLDAPSQTAVDAAWAEESEARIDAFEAGHAPSIPAEQVFEELRLRNRG